LICLGLLFGLGHLRCRSNIANIFRLGGLVRGHSSSSIRIVIVLRHLGSKFTKQTSSLGRVHAWTLVLNQARLLVHSLFILING
jgi:hypothetical protein